ncbi:MAG: hypothetical protein ACI9CZ_000820, partial [Flavobacterium sp.]
QVELIVFEAAYWVNNKPKKSLEIFKAFYKIDAFN